MEKAINTFIDLIQKNTFPLNLKAVSQEYQSHPFIKYYRDKLLFKRIDSNNESRKQWEKLGSDLKLEFPTHNVEIIDSHIHIDMIVLSLKTETNNTGSNSEKESIIVSRSALLPFYFIHISNDIENIVTLSQDSMELEKQFILKRVEDIFLNIMPSITYLPLSIGLIEIFDMELPNSTIDSCCIFNVLFYDIDFKEYKIIGDTRYKYEEFLNFLKTLVVGSKGI